MYEDAQKLVKPLIQLLPEKYAVPLHLSDIEEMKQADVSKKLNLSLTATKSRIQRARKMLKEKIMECSILEMDSKEKLISIEIKPACKPLQEDPEKNIE